MGRDYYQAQNPIAFLIHHAGWSKDEKSLAVVDEKYLWVHEVLRSVHPPKVSHSQSKIREITYQMFIVLRRSKSVRLSRRSSLDLWAYRQKPKGKPDSVFYGFSRCHPHRPKPLLGLNPHSVIVLNLPKLSRSAPFVLSGPTQEEDQEDLELSMSYCSVG